MPQTPEVIVVGAGVVGLSAALALQMRGLSVTVVDREGPAAGASAGNAGALAFTDILPLASPGMLWKAPKWLLDPLGPLTVPPSHALKIAPWMLRFARACAPAQVRRSTLAQIALMNLARAELGPFLAATGTKAMLRREGNLQVYETEAEYRAALPGWQMRIDHGIEVVQLDRAGIDALQPGLSPRFQRATFTPGWQSVTDPKDFTLALADRFRANGGTLARGEARVLTPLADGVTVALASGEALSAAHVVLAAGARSHLLARGLGDRIPLETERGYNTTLPADAFDLRTQVTFGAHGFVATRLTSGIRVGGAVELGGLDLPPNFRRADAMLRKAQAFLPGLKVTGG